MLLPLQLSALVVLFCALPTWAFTARDAAAVDPFNWKPCPSSVDDRWRCGHITVPWSYTDPNEKRTMQIETVLFQSGKTRSNHTILINPGGPDVSGVSAAWYAAEEVARDFTNNTFDILGFDPRGVNASVPHISCYPNDAARDHWAYIGASYREKRRPGSGAVAHRCYGDVLDYLTTALVARDMDTIRAALGEDKLYYYATSYGTAMGLTYAGLYPDRVGRMLLDGIEDIFNDRSYIGYGNGSSYGVMDVYHDGFIGECIRAGPKGCALARAPDNSTDTVDGLRKRLDAVFQKLIDRPAPAWHPDIGYGIVQYGSVVDLLFQELYNPRGWPDYADAISQYERGGNASRLLQYTVGKSFVEDGEEKCPKPKRSYGSDLYSYVACGDAFDGPNPDLNGWLEFWKDLNDRAFVGADGNFFSVFACRQSDVKSADVFRGDLRANLSSPILLVSSTYDPITPLHNAQRIYQELGPRNSRLLLHHGYGHSSLSNPSTCSEALKKDYILNGNLPQGEQPVECYADNKPYPVGDKPQAMSAMSKLVATPASWRRPGGRY